MVVERIALGRSELKLPSAMHKEQRLIEKPWIGGGKQSPLTIDRHRHFVVDNPQQIG